MSEPDAPALRRLHPTPDVDMSCPECEERLTSTGWYMPGMRVLATLECPGCGGEFYGDIPTGDAWHGPALIDSDSGKVYAERDDFMTTWLRSSFADRSKRSVDIEVHRRRELDRPAVLNCLDAMYGHSLLKLLNAQYYVDREDVDLIVVVPRILEWIVPDDVAAVWSVDLPLSRGTEWNDRLARQFAKLIGEYETVDVCIVRPHPTPDGYDIERFSGVSPFPIDEWEAERPTVTFVWRDDRHWSPIPPAGIVRDWLGTTVSPRLETNPLVERLGSASDEVGRRIQHRRVERLASALGQRVPEVDFAVAGLGTAGNLDGIEDLRVAAPDADDERALCRRYAKSHVVVGVHGSNMLLPSAHAGGVVELLPDRRRGNMGQDLLPRTSGAKPTMFHYRTLPLSSSPEDVAEVVTVLLEKREYFETTMF